MVITSNISTITVTENVSQQLCNWGYNHYDATIRATQSKSEIQWDIYNNLGAFAYKRPGVKVILNYTPSHDYDFTDFSFIDQRISIAENYAQRYDYGIPYLVEEFYSIAQMHNWMNHMWNHISHIGTRTYEGVVCDLLQNWYIKKYGSSAWNAYEPTYLAIRAAGIAAANDNDPTTKYTVTDPTFLAWSYEYSHNLFVVWRKIMDRLNKGVGFIGYTWMGSNTFERNLSSWFGPYIDWMFSNLDWLQAYTYPKTEADLYTRPPNQLINMIRARGYTGWISYNLGICFADNWGCPATVTRIKKEFDIIHAVNDPKLMVAFAGTTGTNNPNFGEPSAPLPPLVIQWNQ